MSRSMWVNGYEGRYKVTDLGEVIRVRKSKTITLKPATNKWGYFRVGLIKDGVRANFRVNVLVAKHFVPGFRTGLQANHKNGIKTDNRAENLEWVTPGENIQHGLESGLFKNLKPVIAINRNTKKEILFKSISEAARELGIHITGIQKCRSGKRKYSQGYYFRAI